MTPSMVLSAGGGNLLIQDTYLMKRARGKKVHFMDRQKP